jgi:predicted RNase H-like HicB family nuclease
VRSWRLRMEGDVRYKVKLERTEEGYAVWCPGLPGCWSQGATEQEALENATDAVQTYLATVEETAGRMDPAGRRGLTAAISSRRSRI